MIVGMREIFEFAVEEFVCFFDGLCPVIRAGELRPYVWKKFGGICFTPCGVGIKVGRDGRFEPMLEWTVIPCVLRCLQADESGAEAKGIGEAKG